MTEFVAATGEQPFVSPPTEATAKSLLTKNLVHRQSLQKKHYNDVFFLFFFLNGMTLELPTVAVAFFLSKVPTRREFAMVCAHTV